MKQSILRLFALTFAISMLSACFGPKRPQEVTQAFWEAVVKGDAENAVEYSTLTSPENYNGFDKEWQNFQPSWGKVVIDGDKASIETRFARQTNDGKDERDVTTYLVRRHEVWLVDYERTAEDVNGGILGNLFGALSRIGNDLSKQMQSSADEFNANMDRMGKELEERSNTLGEEASKSIDIYSKELRKNIEALKESVNNALKDNSNEVSDEERKVLQEVAAGLDEDSQNLDEPTASSVAESSQHLGNARTKLDALNSDAFDKYKAQWQNLSDQFEARMQEMLDRLPSSTEEQSRRY